MFQREKTNFVVSRADTCASLFFSSCITTGATEVAHVPEDCLASGRACRAGERNSTGEEPTSFKLSR
ncbi:hypothetical protein JZ751_005854 [Albula glossodonta]|uniref:Uncharacterized protein n=1 Tax=Albula glossodonta TaxID=121402 RepID=A0A8T2PDV8_9TELE|nr:hypothetical protein JZ751_005854 [Albula glossodonta]